MTATPSSDPQEYVLPCAEAMLAGTLALMTAHVQACCDGQRARIVDKVNDNLAQLAGNPALSPPFRTALWNLRIHWQMLKDAEPQPARDPRLWHAGHQSVQ
jgi:hypothetical protein